MKTSIKAIALTLLLAIATSLSFTSCAGPAYRSDNRQDHRDDRQDSRQDHRDDRQDNRQSRW